MSASRGVFVDTNILIYASDESAGWRRDAAAALLARIWTDGNGCLSTQVLQEYHTNVTRKIPSPISVQESAERIAVYRSWRVFSPSLADVLGAIERQVRWRLSFWDALIVHAAIELGCDILWSEDLQGGQRFEGVEVRNPFAEPSGQAVSN